MGIFTVIWEKWVEFRREFGKITISTMIPPLMYLIVFGFGLRGTSRGESYMAFLVPGLVAMTTMTGSFGAIAQSLSVQRLYERALEQVMVSPTPLWQFVVGQVIGGSLRGMYAAVVVMVITFPVRTGLIFSPLSFFIMFLNGTVFATLALVMSLLAKSHTDASRFTSYVIMPMSFLCNTFFSVDNLPGIFRRIVSLLPLSQASLMIRSIAAGEPVAYAGILILMAYLAIFGAMGCLLIYWKENV